MLPEGGRAGFIPAAVRFDHGEPDCFYDGDLGGTLPYRGQELVKERLRRHIDGLGRTQRRVKALLTGPAGTGKTTLARITANEIMERHLDLRWGDGCGGGYIEVLADQLRTKAQVDALMNNIMADPFCVVSIDEVHVMGVREPLYHVLHDTGAPKYPLDNGEWLEIPDTISFIAMTTEPGLLEEAIRRRFEPELVLEPPSREVLANIVSDQAEVEGLVMHSDAAFDIAERAVFPWQAKKIYEEARLSAALNNEAEINPKHANDAFRVMQIDRAGLLPEDRNVIKALLRVNGGLGIALVSNPNIVRFRMGEESLCAIAGVDRITYKKRIQPKLLRLGLIVTIGGQCLTDRALDAYGFLRDE